MRKSSSLALASAALMASALSGGTVPTGSHALGADAVRVTGEKPTKQTPARPSGDASAMMRALLGGGPGRRRGLPQGPGWGYAKVKRMAAKRRNVLRNKRAQRRAK